MANLTGKEMVKRSDELFKKYRPYTLKLPGGSSITMDNLESMIKECSRLGIPFDPSTYPSRRGEKPKEETITDLVSGDTDETKEEKETSESDVVDGSNTAKTKPKVQPKSKTTKVTRGGNTAKPRRGRPSTKGK